MIMYRMTRVCFGSDRSGFNASSDISPWLKKGAANVDDGLVFASSSSSASSTTPELLPLLSSSAAMKGREKDFLLVLAKALGRKEETRAWDLWECDAGEKPSTARSADAATATNSRHDNWLQRVILFFSFVCASAALVRYCSWLLCVLLLHFFGLRAYMYRRSKTHRQQWRVFLFSSFARNNTLLFAFSRFHKNRLSLLGGGGCALLLGNLLIRCAVILVRRNPGADLHQKHHYPMIRFSYN